MSSSNALPGFEPTQHHQRHARVALVPGSRVGEFEIVRVLGVGGFSIVYLARDPALDRLVAIKEYLPSALAMRGEGPQVELRTASNAPTFEQGLDSFIDEARMLARFDHPSLVRVHHFWKANGTAYMAMRYLEGSTLLAARRAMPRPPDEAWLRALLGSLLGAVETLHAASCLHRDISPDNILLLPDATPVLLDFGAARSIVGEGSQQLTAILKPGFAPIEQYAEATDLRQGPWTDLYALGAVVRNCITARPPIPSTVRAVSDRQPSLALEARSVAANFAGLNYSPGFLAAIDWALALHPSDRPQSVAQFKQALALGEAASRQAAGAFRNGSFAGVGVLPASPKHPTASADRPVHAMKRVLASARSAAALLLRQRWPAAATPLSAPEPAADLNARHIAPAAALAPAGATGEESGSPRSVETVRQAVPGPSPRPARRAWLRLALPWSMAAVLLSAVAGVGWKTFDDHRAGLDMALIASSAAAAAVAVSEEAAPVAFDASRLATEPEPAWIYKRPPPRYEQPEERPVAAMTTPHERASADADLITELRPPVAAPEPQAWAIQRSVFETTGAATEGNARGAPDAPGNRRAGSSSLADASGASRRKTASAPGSSPSRICARQERYTDYVCMQRQCKLSRFHDHAQCANLRKTGWWGFIRLP